MDLDRELTEEEFERMLELDSIGDDPEASRRVNQAFQEAKSLFGTLPSILPSAYEEKQ